MSTQTSEPRTLKWERKLETFVAMFGPFTTKWDEFRSFREVEGFLEVYWPGLTGISAPLIEVDEKPRCACCGSARPMFLRYLTDRNGLKHMVGHECYGRLCELKQVNHIDFDSQNYRNSEDKAG
jgi:hypothetical protein